MTDGPITPEATLEPSEQAAQNSAEISSVEADDKAYEQSAERLDDVLHAESAPKTQIKPIKGSQPTDGADQSTVSVKDPVVIEVERILEDGIGSFYQSMPDSVKAEFKRKGEAVAFEISEMVRTLHVKFKRLIFLISDWLKTIPGVNRFFLEQEAKIKADRIMQLVEARKQDREKEV